MRDVCELVGQLVAATAELFGLDLEPASRAARSSSSRVPFSKGVEVAVDGLVGLVQLGFNAGQLGALIVLSGEVLGLGADDGVRDEAVVVVPAAYR